MTNYVPFDDVQKEIKKIRKENNTKQNDDEYSDITNCCCGQSCLTCILTIYIAILITYMCLVVNPPKFVYILLTGVIFGNSLIASFSLMSVCRKKQSYFLWGTIYFMSICFVNSFSVGIGAYIFEPSVLWDLNNLSMYRFGLFAIFLPGCLCLLGLIIHLTCFNPLCNDTCKKDCKKDLNDYNEV